MDFGFPVIGEMEMIRLDGIAEVGSQFTDRSTELRSYHNLPLTAFEKWAFDLGIREAIHMLENAPRC